MKLAVACVLILFDPVICIICSIIVLSTLFTLLILALVIIDYCYLLYMSFVTQTNTSTMVKHVPQMVGIRSYPSRELFCPPSRVCLNVVKRCFKC